MTDRGSLHKSSTFQRWCEEVPHEFLFAVKASRFLTHMKKLKDPREPLQRLWQRAVALGDKLMMGENPNVLIDKLGSVWLSSVRPAVFMKP